MATNAELSVITEAQLGNKGAVITVKEDDEIIGKLMIGKASLTWFEKGAKSKGRKVTWAEFCNWIREFELVTITPPKS